MHQTYSAGAGSKEAGSTRNYFYFDPSLRAGAWLRPTMDGIILSSVALPSSEHGKPQPDAAVHIHLTVDKDTNGDRRLTESDAKQIAVSTPAGKNFRILVGNADRLNEATLVNPKRLLILYSTGNKLAAVELDPSDPAAAVVQYEVPTALK